MTVANVELVIACAISLWCVSVYREAGQAQAETWDVIGGQLRQVEPYKPGIDTRRPSSGKRY